MGNLPEIKNLVSCNNNKYNLNYGYITSRFHFRPSCKSANSLHIVAVFS